MCPAVKSAAKLLTKDEAPRHLDKLRDPFRLKPYSGTPQRMIAVLHDLAREANFEAKGSGESRKRYWRIAAVLSLAASPMD